MHKSHNLKFISISRKIVFVLVCLFVHIDTFAKSCSPQSQIDSSLAGAINGDKDWVKVAGKGYLRCIDAGDSEEYGCSNDTIVFATANLDSKGEKTGFYKCDGQRGSVNRWEWLEIKNITNCDDDAKKDNESQPKYLNFKETVYDYKGYVVFYDASTSGDYAVSLQKEGYTRICKMSDDRVKEICENSGGRFSNRKCFCSGKAYSLLCSDVIHGTCGDITLTEQNRIPDVLNCCYYSSATDWVWTWDKPGQDKLSYISKGKCINKTNSGASVPGPTQTEITTGQDNVNNQSKNNSPQTEQTDLNNDETKQDKVGQNNNNQAGQGGNQNKVDGGACLQDDLKGVNAKSGTYKTIGGKISCVADECMDDFHKVFINKVYQGYCRANNAEKLPNEDVYDIELDKEEADESGTNDGTKCENKDAEWNDKYQKCYFDKKFLGEVEGLIVECKNVIEQIKTCKEKNGQITDGECKTSSQTSDNTAVTQENVKYKCTNNNGSFKKSGDPGDKQGAYCWCNAVDTTKVNQPKLWFFVLDFGLANSCNSECADECAKRFPS